MILAWLALASFIVFILIVGRPASWSLLEYGVMCVLILPVILIPIQLSRYFREKRASK